MRGKTLQVVESEETLHVVGGYRNKDKENASVWSELFEQELYHIASWKRRKIYLLNAQRRQCQSSVLLVSVISQKNCFSTCTNRRRCAVGALTIFASV